MVKSINEVELEVIRLTGRVRLLEANQKWLVIAIVLLTAFDVGLRLFVR